MNEMFNSSKNHKKRREMSITLLEEYIFPNNTFRKVKMNVAEPILGDPDLKVKIVEHLSPLVLQQDRVDKLR